jgi:hypothetical protein
MSLTRRSFRAALVAGAFVVSASALPATAADPANRGAVATAVDGLPTCADDGVLGTIRSRFAYGAAHVEKRDIELVTIEKIRETDFSLGPSPIARRLCAATVSLSDGTVSRLAYRIERSTGFAAPGYLGLPSGVDFCVVGHDPWRVHDGNCRALTRFW